MYYGMWVFLPYLDIEFELIRSVFVKEFLILGNCVLLDNFTLGANALKTFKNKYLVLRNLLIVAILPKFLRATEVLVLILPSHHIQNMDILNVIVTHFRYTLIN